MNIKYINHSCFVIEIESKKIVIDPYVENENQINQIKDADIVLLSHGHGDHTDGLKYITDKATIITNFELAQFYRKKFNTVDMNFGGEISLNLSSDIIKISMVQAVHTSSYRDGDKMLYGGVACGYIIKSTKTDKCVYFIGDTDMFLDMKLICDYYKPSVILMPIGNHYTMGVDKALYCINNLLSATKIIPMHYKLTNEKHHPTDVTKREFSEFVKKSKIKIEKLDNLQEIKI